MKVPGIVTNITAFGAFVDIGVKHDGLVHVSQLSNRFVSDPNEVVKLQQKVMVTVTEVDVPRKRIALSMKHGREESNRQEVKKQQGGKPIVSKKPDANNPFHNKLAELKKRFND